MYSLCFAFDAGSTTTVAATYVDEAGNTLGAVQIDHQFIRAGSIGISVSISDHFQGFIEFTDAQDHQALVLFAVNPQEGENVNERLSDLRNSESGAGAIEFTYNVVDTSNRPISQCQVWVTSDAVGQNVIAGTLLTNSAGNVTFELDAGDWFLWQRHRSYNFHNPTKIHVG